MVARFSLLRYTVPPVSKRALITGITGQDGSYLAEYLLSLGYEVHGLVRRVAAPTTEARFARIRHILDKITLHSATIESYASLFEVLARQRFDECYHLAAQSSISSSFADEFSTMAANVNGTHHLLAILKLTAPDCRFYFASSSEMFGNPERQPQNEQTPFRPRSIYGVSKVTGFELTRYYRAVHGMFCSSGILFNHESPRRGEEFVTRKITRAVAEIVSGKRSELRLGDLEARRDWGHAADYVRAMHLTLQQALPDDFVIATGVAHTVREFCQIAFSRAGLKYTDYVRSDARLMRPLDTHTLVGDSSKARAKLGWQPSTTFEELVAEMVDSDMADVAAAVR